MKARLSFYAPDGLPDIPALTARYERLILMVKVLILARDYAGVLKTSFEIGRAVRALIKGKTRAAAQERKFQMLLSPVWRARVISDLGGMRKLALWNAAMKRAVLRSFDNKHRWRPEAMSPSSGFIPPQIIAAQKLESARRERIRDCARACANPNIFKDPFRVDFDGNFRLPAVPRAPASGVKSSSTREYEYDARPINKLTGIHAPAMVWPAEFYAAERGNWTRTQEAAAVAYGKTPGAKRRPGGFPAPSSPRLRAFFSPHNQ